ncbi:YggS family pyridoxal phosphate-dependent enzyme [Pseudohalioglobus lutimaris]|uniref:Pyridoxal phosphate homeostasis protein n=1 Tax=Pseudohalioglobus lutimaris TaxID=1737061 RepID=A0A2N5X906_9GAMM|nr:YggS family pyridoxal phosphate-dependent enzyme [Pseudohalioglobus lutimaris]PLW70972.1 YggS family pyridoxal phosphate-dependent enzyme [Pseudohalioglobus lutimaris]
MTHTSIENNIAKLRLRLRQSVEKYDRQESDILLMAVSKTRPAADIREAYACGLDQFGESYLQEASKKIEELADLPLTWHFIGPLQSNKTRPIAEQFQWVHSVAREKVARRLDEQRPAGKPPLQVCLQVNISGEQSKSGVSLAGLPALAEFVESLPRLRLRGLMAIPAATDRETDQRAQFARLREAFSALQSQHPDMDTLSMGMSADMEAAIAEGSNLLRIGTAIFGPRRG